MPSATGATPSGDPVATAAAHVGAAPTPSSQSNQLPGVASQIVSVLSPLRTAPTGTQTVTIVLHPAELGDVRATVIVNNDQVTVRLVASTPEGTSALRSALPDLRSGLSADGQRSTVVLGDPGASSFGTGQGGPGSGAGYQAEPAVPPRLRSFDATAPLTAPEHTVARGTLHRLLDVRL